MIRKVLSLAAAAAICAATPATAQEVSQDELQERYDRALAAGYKALFLCSAIANAERNGATRTPESVFEWELSGIQAPLDKIVPTLHYEIVRGGRGAVDYVSVDWAQGSPPRIARYRGRTGCSILPIGAAAYSGTEEHYGYNARAAALWHPTPDAQLDPVLDASFSGVYGAGTRTTAALVETDNGRRTASRFAPGYGITTPQRTWSVAKSIAATIVGAAVHRGDANVLQSADLGETTGDPRRSITIDHALRMASGRYSNTAGSRTDALYYGGATVDEVALDWPMVHQAGTFFRYANNDTLAAVQAIEHTFFDHTPASVLRAMRMLHTAPETDWQGNYILSSQVWATAHDLATLGQLYLNNGVTRDGTRILPENWLEYVSTPSGPQPDGPLGYGASWWLVNKSQGIPTDTIAAIGNRGQYLIVVPSRDVVIVRRGEDPVGSRFDFIAFTRDVLAALATDDAPAP